MKIEITFGIDYIRFFGRKMSIWWVQNPQHYTEPNYIIKGNMLTVIEESIYSKVVVRMASIK